MSEEELPELKTVSEAPGVDTPPAPKIENTLPKKECRYFIIGCALGLVVSCFLAFVFFLMVEDNPRVLLNFDLIRLLAPLIVIDVILVGIALFARRGWWNIPLGFTLAALVIVAVTANWVRNNHPIPTPEQKCATVKELYEVVKEGKTIAASTPATQSRDWHSRLVEVWKRNFKTIQFLPKSNQMDLMNKEFDALEGEEKTGTAAMAIQTKRMYFEFELRNFISLNCSTQ